MMGLASSTLALRLRRCSEFPGLIPSHELDTLVEAIHQKAGGKPERDWERCSNWTCTSELYLLRCPGGK